ncbi:hypothetical protein EIP91_003885 [Steccherinum ochraceum]|uniref:Uncharacterized protein n=1 Tax=Steccherinum ochraceum TaxID=92696 RepID=A0A4R0RI79_9APHY|nr:hypothetical protein EIP91_003885 [Steccherinum ochraceum]
MLGLLGTAAFSTLRIWAICGHATGPTLAVALASAVVPAVNIYTNSQITFSAIVDGGCLFDVGYTLAVYDNAVATDALVLALTWTKTVGVWRESRRIQGLKVTVTTLLLRDGTLYFGMLLITNVVALVLDIFRTNIAAGSSFAVVVNAVGANLLSRFMLDLRSVTAQGSSKGRTMSSINFDIRSFGGNIGAPLGIEDSTWVTGPADDVANERDQQYEAAAVPFHAGLGLDVEEVPLETANSADCEASSSRIEYSAVIESRGDVQDAPRNEPTSADGV